MADFDLLALCEQDTVLRQTVSAGKNGGEWVGPCPLPGCTSDDDAFNVWPNHPDGPRWWCRQCDRSGDVIAYLVEMGRITKGEAWAMRHGDEVDVKRIIQVRGHERLQ